MPCDNIIMMMIIIVIMTLVITTLTRIALIEWKPLHNHSLIMNA